MVLAARADGVISMEITGGDSRDPLEVVGDGVDAVRLVSCLRRKLGHAEILQVEEVKHENQEYETDKEPDEPPPQCLCYHGYCCCHHLPAPPMVVCEEPSNCPVM
ncbi:hypothetical protein HU200_027574 [Digitaria exilis]|uniref:Uncharacterized protein n=1 Tax=Digitaria exilis TaxID=1010633 RepID=A0A835BXC2_9POAL|nr:hypothetical protein HU200_027574 [Digitaria exilis]